MALLAHSNRRTQSCLFTARSSRRLPVHDAPPHTSCPNGRQGLVSQELAHGLREIGGERHRGGKSVPYLQRPRCHFDGEIDDRSSRKLDISITSRQRACPNVELTSPRPLGLRTRKGKLRHRPVARSPYRALAPSPRAWRDDRTLRETGARIPRRVCGSDPSPSGPMGRTPLRPNDREDDPARGLAPWEEASPRADGRRHHRRQGGGRHTRTFPGANYRPPQPVHGTRGQRPHAPHAPGMKLRRHESAAVNPKGKCPRGPAARARSRWPPANDRPQPRQHRLRRDLPDRASRRGSHSFGKLPPVAPPSRRSPTLRPPASSSHPPRPVEPFSPEHGPNGPALLPVHATTPARVRLVSLAVALVVSGGDPLRLATRGGS